MKDIEIEIQVQVSGIDKLEKFLEENAEFDYEQHQKDQYFTPAHRNFLDQRPTKEWLRLRDADGQVSINYKNWYYTPEGKSTHCDEYESGVEHLDQLEKIFTALNVEPVAVVDKVRKAWKYKEYEVSIDRVKDLGDFVEIEYKGSSEVDPETTTKAMTDFLKEVGCTNIMRNYVGYPFQIMFPDEVKLEEI